MQLRHGDRCGRPSSGWVDDTKAVQRASANPAELYLQTERFHQVGHRQAVVCPDAILVEALRMIRAPCSRSTTRVGSITFDRAHEGCRSERAEK